MRVEFDVLEDFCHEISAEVENIVDGMVRVQVRVEPESEIRQRVSVVATAIVKKDTGSYLCELIMDVGSEDSRASKGPFLASERAAAWEKEITDLAVGYELEVRSGKWELI